MVLSYDFVILGLKTAKTNYIRLANMLINFSGCHMVKAQVEAPGVSGPVV